jgi:hypothetical protein
MLAAGMAMVTEMNAVELLAVLLLAAGCSNDSSDDGLTSLPDAAAVVGHDAGSAGNDSGARDPDSGAAVDEPASAICDGSDEIRLGMWTTGGFVGAQWWFMNPYGGEFAFVDGHCAFHGSTNAMHGIVTGTLSASEAEQLASEVGWTKIDAFSRHIDVCGPDAGESKISNGSHAFGCSCDCDAGAPAGLAAAEAASHVWVKRLVERGAPFDGAVRALLLEAGDGVMRGTPKWPLTRSPSEFLVPGMLDATAGTVVDDPEEAAQLRMLRQATIEQTPDAAQVLVDIGTVGTYALLVRDELPPSLASATAAFQSPPMK